MRLFLSSYPTPGSSIVHSPKDPDHSVRQFLRRFTSMERRRRSRLPRRLTCEIAWPGLRTSGIVRNISDRGVFVETLADPKPNSVVKVVFTASGDRPNICVEAGVARKRLAPRHLQASVPSGIGLEILPPRAEYERWLAQPNCLPLGRAVEVEVAGPFRTHHEHAMTAYRFQMTRRAGSSPQFLTIHCETEAGARTQALTRAGAGWRIVDVQPL